MCKYRMYCLVLKQLSPIQKGVQSAHSIVEYANMFSRSLDYINWSKVDKTIIMLDGGTYSEMINNIEFISSLKVPYSIFKEEDLNNLITSISFLMPEQVWDKETYPSFEEELDSDNSDMSEKSEWLINMGGMRNLKLRNFIFSKKLSI